MLGVIAPAPAEASAVAAPRPAAPSFTRSEAPPEDVSIAGLPSPRKRTAGCLVTVLGATLLVALGSVGALVYFRTLGRGPTVTASVGQGASGEVLRLTVLDAAPGAAVRFAGESRAIENGRVELPLSADALHLGDNVLVVELVNGANVVEVPVTITLEYRVRADLAGLESTPPTFDVVLEALPGSTATVDGTPLPLDARGIGRRTVSLASLREGPDGAYSHTASYSVTPPGRAPATGSLVTRVPTTPLHLLRPLDGAVTDLASLEVVGQTSAGQPPARVTVEGRDVEVGADGSFRVEVPLPEPGPDGLATLHVVARRPANAPRAMTVAVRRVPNLRRAASEVVVDRSIGYAQLADQPEVVRGRMVAFEGEVYNADVQGGRGILQVLYVGCSRQGRCPLWVTYSPATAIERGSVVRIVGIAGGTQQFRAESGETRTVPRVDATYVVP